MSAYKLILTSDLAWQQQIYAQFPQSIIYVTHLAYNATGSCKTVGYL